LISRTTVSARALLLRAFLLVVSTGSILLHGCGDGGATGPNTSAMEIVVLSGDGQAAGPGALLPEPLQVRVQALSNGSVREGVKVRWDIADGTGAQLEPASSVTDSAGVTEARLTLGPNLGTYRIRASVAGMAAPPARFEAQAILEPELTGVPEDQVSAGDTVLLEGRNFSSDPGQNVITFSGIRGRTVAAAPEELMVEVPSCLPTGDLPVQVRIGTFTTETRSMRIRGGEEFLNLSPGEDRIIDASEGLGCFRLPSASDATYLLVIHSTGTVGGAEYPVQLLGLSEASPVPGAGQSMPLAFPVPALSGSEEGPVPAEHWLWEARFRAWEREWLGAPTEREEAPAPVSPARPAPPEIGDERDFMVLNRENEFDQVTAEIRYITEHCLIYVDRETPAAGFDDEDLAFFAGQFESAIYPTVTGVFGPESDLDGNGRVIVLFTPGVNRLTEEGSDGYVGGYFFGLDLQTDKASSNKGEIFYAVVPDPTGENGPVLSRTNLLNSLPAILAHEFEHMVHFNQRILEAGASGQEALWLSESLAQMAEDLVGEAFLASGDPVSAMDYQLGNWTRARRFLLNPSQVSVLTTLPPGTLAERGAGWLLLRHLYGREGGQTFIRSLTASTRTGVENVTASIGRDWPDVITDWAGSLYLDGLPVPVRTGLTMLGIDLREILARLNGEYPLNPTTLGQSTFSISSTLWSSAPNYYILTTPESGGLALSLNGFDGRAPDPASRLRMLVVRLE